MPASGQVSVSLNSNDSFGCRISFQRQRSISYLLLARPKIWKPSANLWWLKGTRSWAVVVWTLQSFSLRFSVIRAKHVNCILLGDGSSHDGYLKKTSKVRRFALQIWNNNATNICIFCVIRVTKLNWPMLAIYVAISSPHRYASILNIVFQSLSLKGLNGSPYSVILYLPNCPKQSKSSSYRHRNHHD